MNHLLIDTFTDPSHPAPVAATVAMDAATAPARPQADREEIAVPRLTNALAVSALFTATVAVAFATGYFAFTQWQQLPPVTTWWNMHPTEVPAFSPFVLSAALCAVTIFVARHLLAYTCAMLAQLAWSKSRSGATLLVKLAWLVATKTTRQRLRPLVAALTLSTTVVFSSTSFAAEAPPDDLGWQPTVSQSAPATPTPPSTATPTPLPTATSVLPTAPPTALPAPPSSSTQATAVSTPAPSTTLDTLHTNKAPISSPATPASPTDVALAEPDQTMTSQIGSEYASAPLSGNRATAERGHKHARAHVGNKTGGNHLQQQVTVRRGDTLWDLVATHWDTDDPEVILRGLSELIALNEQVKDNPDLIFPGQIITLPARP